MTEAILSGVRSGNIAGTPVALPSDWSLISGYLIGPGADLNGADLTDADLTGADLTDADLTGADLTGADLTDAILSGAHLTGADFTDAILTDVTWGAGSLGSVLAAEQADLAAAETDLAAAQADLAAAQAELAAAQTELAAAQADLENKYSLDEIIDLRPGSVMIAVEGESATMTLQLQTSTDLNDWQDAGDPAEVSLPTDDASVRFYRFNH